MEPRPNPGRAAGALRFLAELETFAMELLAAGIFDDELSLRRTRRVEVRRDPVEEPLVKAL